MRHAPPILFPGLRESTATLVGPHSLDSSPSAQTITLSVPFTKMSTPILDLDPTALPISRYSGIGRIDTEPQDAFMVGPRPKAPVTARRGHSILGWGATTPLSRPLQDHIFDTTLAFRRSMRGWQPLALPQPGDPLFHEDLFDVAAAVVQAHNNHARVLGFVKRLLTLTCLKMVERDPLLAQQTKLPEDFKYCTECLEEVLIELSEKFGFKGVYRPDSIHPENFYQRVALGELIVDEYFRDQSHTRLGHAIPAIYLAEHFHMTRSSRRLFRRMYQFMGKPKNRALWTTYFDNLRKEARFFGNPLFIGRLLQKHFSTSL